MGERGGEGGEGVGELLVGVGGGLVLLLREGVMLVMYGVSVVERRV